MSDIGNSYAPMEPTSGTMMDKFEQVLVKYKIPYWRSHDHALGTLGENQYTVCWLAKDEGDSMSFEIHGVDPDEAIFALLRIADLLTYEREES